MTTDILSLTSNDLISQARAVLPSGSGVAAQLYPLAFSAGRFAVGDFPLSAASAAAWQSHFHVGLLTVARVTEEEGEFGTTSKAILRTSDGYEIECVRIPMRIAPERQSPTTDQVEGEVHYTLCLSSQVGCKMGCTFCETGRMGLLRHLSAAEIVAEVVTVKCELGWSARNLVFMGMGEALDNADNLIQALRVLVDRRGLMYSQERITVCTAGHAEGLEKLRELGWKRLNLALSLNAANDALRDRLMPVNRKTPLAALQRVLMSYPQRRNFTLAVNYCLMPGLNDAPADAQDVAAFCQPLGRVLINLIPYNPGSAPLTRAPSEDEVERFLDALRALGLAVRRRITKGRSIMAACGQLGNVALRRRPAASRDSVIAEFARATTVASFTPQTTRPTESILP